MHEHARGNVRINIAYRYVISDVLCFNKIMNLTGRKEREGQQGKGQQGRDSNTENAPAN